MKVLHIVPAQAALPSFRYLGSTKDFLNRWDYFQDRGIDYEVLFHAKSGALAIEGTRQWPLEEFTHVVIEKAIYPAFVRHLRSRWPHLKLIYRSQNAEVPHRMDYVKSAWRANRNVRQVMQTGLIYIHREWSTLSKLDEVWSISPAEMGWYWRMMGLTGQARLVPFFLPRTYLKEIPPPAPACKICLCMTSSHAGPVAREAIRGFFEWVEAERETLGEWKFIVTAKPEARDLPIPDSLKGLVEYEYYKTPYEGLAQARVVAMLSEAGRGFKTKLLEAVLCGASLVTPKELYDRLPESIQAYTKVVSQSKKGSLVEVLETLWTEARPTEGVNQALRRQAYEAMDLTFGLATAPQKSGFLAGAFRRVMKPRERAAGT